MNDRLHVCFTMDVERIHAMSPTGGPATWEAGAASVTDFCGCLRALGFPVTLFIVPDAASEQAALFQRLRADGHECGLHLHPQSWGENHLQPEAWDYLGNYSAAQQGELIGKAGRQFIEALGFAPRSFRGGNFSANDSTFAILAALGFTCGSVSQPDRCVPQFGAVWHAAHRGVHRAHAGNRLIPGRLDLIEVPATTDTTRTDHWTGVGDARIEENGIDDIMKAVEDSLSWQARNHAPLEHVAFLTHNFVDYGTSAGSLRQRLSGLVERLSAFAAGRGQTIVGATMTMMRDAHLAAEQMAGASGSAETARRASPRSESR